MQLNWYLKLARPDTPMCFPTKGNSGGISALAEAKIRLQDMPIKRFSDAQSTSYHYALDQVLGKLYG